MPRLALPNPGIAARLTAAFTAVAILAVAANLLAGGSQRAQPVVRVVEKPAAVSAQAPVSGAVAAPLPAIDTRTLLLAMNAWSEATHARSTGGVSNQAAWQSATQDLRTEINTTLRSQAAGASRAGRALDRELTAHLGAGEQLVASGDTLQSDVLAWRAAFDRLDIQISGALDGAFRIFGRVIARQSLMALGRLLDDMRPHLTLTSAQVAPDPASLGKLAAIEADFAAILASSRDGLQRSQGAGWLAVVEKEQAGFAALRLRLDADRSRNLELLTRFRERTPRLQARLRELPDKFAREIAAATANTQNAEAAATPGGATRGPGSRGARKPGVPAQSLDAEPARNAVLLWISVAVLLLLFLISAGTVASIVRPVRRLITATEQVAAGGAAHIPRGGIREIDTLAVAFNTMAERLTEAREITRQYHAQLEAKVDERTRQLKLLAEHDPLTQLANRRQLFRQLTASLAGAQSSSHLVGVLFLDLDNFKNINDSMGHIFGDRVLQALADRLREACGACGVAARLGGDEFTIVTGPAGSVDEVAAAADTLVAAFRSPLKVDDRELSVGVSVGVSVFPLHGADPDELLRAADAALFRAKTLGRNQSCVFSAELLAAAEARFSTEQSLRRAIEQDEFELFFQPELGVATGRVEIVEALLRWRQPGGRWFTPDAFLSVAEESGLIRPMNAWVVRAAVATAAHWFHGVWPEVRVAVNVSSRQLVEGDFVSDVQKLLADRRLPSRCIEFELTENVLQTDPGTVSVLRRLRAAGFGVALDDFGTGYSSLVSLAQLPLTRVKLDRALIANIEGSARSLAIAQATISLCEDLALEITAEGIERPAQLASLIGRRGMYLQGFLFSPAVPAAEIPALLPEMEERLRSLVAPEAARRSAA